VPRPWSPQRRLAVAFAQRRAPGSQDTSWLLGVDNGTSKSQKGRLERGLRSSPGSTLQAAIGTVMAEAINPRTCVNRCSPVLAHRLHPHVAWGGNKFIRRGWDHVLPTVQD
jgi:hypothetical protein